MNRALQWIYNYNLGSKFLTQCILFISLCLVISYILPWPCFPSFPSTPCGCTAQCAFPIKKLVIQHFTYLSSHLFYIHMLTSLMGFFHIYSWYLTTPSTVPDNERSLNQRINETWDYFLTLTSVIHQLMQFVIKFSHFYGFSIPLLIHRAT
jgi:hypothetical protein